MCFVNVKNLNDEASEFLVFDFRIEANHAVCSLLIYSFATLEFKKRCHLIIRNMLLIKGKMPFRWMTLLRDLLWVVKFWEQKPASSRWFNTKKASKFWIEYAVVYYIKPFISRNFLASCFKSLRWVKSIQALYLKY